MMISLYFLHRRDRPKKARVARAHRLDPPLNIPLSQHDLRIRIRLDQLVGEQHTRDIRNALQPSAHQHSSPSPRLPTNLIPPKQPIKILRRLKTLPLPTRKLRLDSFPPLDKRIIVGGVAAAFNAVVGFDAQLAKSDVGSFRIFVSSARALQAERWQLQNVAVLDNPKHKTSIGFPRG